MVRDKVGKCVKNFDNTERETLILANFGRGQRTEMMYFQKTSREVMPEISLKESGCGMR